MIFSWSLISLLRGWRSYLSCIVFLNSCTFFQGGGSDLSRESPIEHRLCLCTSESHHFFEQSFKPVSTRHPCRTIHQLCEIFHVRSTSTKRPWLWPTDSSDLARPPDSTSRPVPVDPMVPWPRLNILCWTSVDSPVSTRCPSPDDPRPLWVISHLLNPEDRRTNDCRHGILSFSWYWLLFGEGDDTGMSLWGHGR